MEDIGKDGKPCLDDQGKRVMLGAVLNFVALGAIALIVVEMQPPSEDVARITYVQDRCSVEAYNITGFSCTACQGYGPIPAGEVEGTRKERDAVFKSAWRWWPWFAGGPPEDPWATAEAVNSNCIVPTSQVTGPEQTETACDMLQWDCYRVVATVRIGETYVSGSINTTADPSISTKKLYPVYLPTYHEEDVHAYGSCVQCRCDSFKLAEQVKAMVRSNSTVMCHYDVNDVAASLSLRPVRPTFVSSTHIKTMCILIGVVMVLSSACTCWLCWVRTWSCCGREFINSGAGSSTEGLELQTSQTGTPAYGSVKTADLKTTLTVDKVKGLNHSGESDFSSTVSSSQRESPNSISPILSYQK